MDSRQQKLELISSGSAVFARQTDYCKLRSWRVLNNWKGFGSKLVPCGFNLQTCEHGDMMAIGFADPLMLQRLRILIAKLVLA